MPKANPLSEALRRSATPTPSTRRSAPEPGEGTRLVGAHFPPAVQRQLRMLAAREDRTVRSLLAEALNGLFTDRQLPPVA